MSDVTAERRLELIRCIREENNRNRMRLNTREHILYGKRQEAFGDYEEGYDTAAGEAYASRTKRETAGLFSGLWIRTLLATVIFAAYVILDFWGGSILTVDADSIHTRISENYAPNIIDFIEEIPYTLKDTK